jgi:hypothetical protein
MADNAYPEPEDFEAFINKMDQDRCKCSAQGVQFTIDGRIVCRICEAEVRYE